MTIADVGDGYGIEYQARDPDTGDLIAATVALTVTDPSGDITTPTPTNPSLGIYRHLITGNEAGRWIWRWDVTGAVTDVAHGAVEFRSPAPAAYATLPALKRYLLGQEQADVDTYDNTELEDALASVCREIDSHCGRRFWGDDTATARVFYPATSRRAVVTDFYTTTGLIIATDNDDDGVYETTWSASDYQLEPLNGIVDGLEGFPFWRIRAVGAHLFPCHGRRAPLQVTARWGWRSVPEPVRQTTLILAAETHKLRQAPWGIAGFGGEGVVVRVRQNPLAERKLFPYQLKSQSWNAA